jgi:N-acetylglucosamine-6-phosphate deacetylase
MSEAVLNGTQVTIANKSTELKQSLAAEMLKVNKSLDFDKSMDEIETMECLQMLSA